MTCFQTKWIAVAISVGVGTISASGASAQDVPDIVGSWQCTSDGVSAYHGFQPGGEWQHQMVITEQRALMFRGYIQFDLDRLIHSDSHINIEGHEVVDDQDSKVTIREDFVGTFGWDNAFTIVDHGDLGVREGSIHNKDTLRQVFRRPGDAPIASREVCTRLK
ncbi:hypothetical protein [Pseudoruegeria sp. HB172150]|uniref:hypothetical protein n=1 Tax=Pseudoruegeria sp. HB172150 TaxID=2721164 RepID=UPI001557544C|nr:hypothetical protein [Pseudoruegeria sp. HB172150]